MKRTQQQHEKSMECEQGEDRKEKREGERQFFKPDRFLVNKRKENMA